MEIAAEISVPYNEETIPMTIYVPRHTHYGKSYYTVSFEGEDHVVERDKAGKWLCKSIGKDLCGKIVKEIERLKME